MGFGVCVMDFQVVAVAEGTAEACGGGWVGGWVEGVRGEGLGLIRFFVLFLLFLSLFLILIRCSFNSRG